MKSSHPSLVLSVRAIAMVAILAAALALAPSSASAQSPPWPNGCSIMLPFYIQQGIDGIFLGACDRHDLCWGQCNGPSAPYLGLAHRQDCDLTLYGELIGACIAEAAFIAFPIGGFETANDFIQDCGAVATTIYAAVASPLGTPLFWSSQCLRGCNPNACAAVPPTCGTGVGPGFCYIEAPPPPNPCQFVNCLTDCDTPLGRLCCIFCRPCRPQPPEVPLAGEDPAGANLSVDPKSAKPSGPTGPTSNVNCGCV